MMEYLKDYNINEEQINLALQINETVNYFNFCQAMKELFETKRSEIVKTKKRSIE